MTFQRAKSRDGEFDCINALDYPWALDDGAVVIWTSYGKWPDPDRTLRFLSRTQKDAMRGFALLTPNHRDAVRFHTEVEARSWLGEQNAMRPQPWAGLNITTVQQLKLAFGFYVVEGDSSG